MHPVLVRPKISAPVPSASPARNLSTGLCFLFGVALLLNIHPMSDGGWLWYARYLHEGRRLYADMHLPLQPLFVLQTEWNMTLFGSGWLVSKLPAILQLIAFVLGLRWLAGYLPLRDWQKGLLLASAFCLCTLFEAYRLDDYHVPADCLEVYSILFLLWLHKHRDSERHGIAVALLLGIFSGLSITTRLTDGGMLFLTAGVALWVILPRRRWVSSGLFLFATLSTILFVVRPTGDGLRDYFTYSVFRAAGSKGGTGSVLRAPLLFPFKIVIRFLHTPIFDKILAATLVVILCVLLLTFHSRGLKGRLSVGRVLLGLLPLLLLARFMAKQTITGRPAVALSGAWMLIALVLSAMIVIRTLQAISGWRKPEDWSATETLFLIPAGQLLSESMSSGVDFLGLFAPVGMFLLLLPIASPIPIRRNWQTVTLMVCAFIMLISTISFKAHFPFSWHTYIEAPMFFGREWYQHPLYGPMFLETKQLKYIKPVCEAIHGDSHPELLSLPYPYPNYFCGVPPWHGYVQTFFDTTSQDTILHLMGELDTVPPRWIVYQRQPLILDLHERAFNAGKPLPHRFLDAQIMDKLASGEWREVSHWDSGTDSDWMLIETYRQERSIAKR